MGLATILPILLAVSSSYLIVSIACARTPRKKVELYLFSGNNRVLALSSELGSLLSLSVACTALLSSGFIYGWQVLLSGYAGAVAAAITLHWCSSNQKIMVHIEDSQKSGGVRGASQFIYLAARKGSRVGGFFGTAALLFYSILMITELALARVLLIRIAGAEGSFLALSLVLLAAVCFLYVTMGGFRGVLYTDHFQFIVIVLLVGSLLGSVDLPGFFSSLPLATHSLLPGDREFAVVLHICVFLGGFLLLVGSVDQWIRLFGTLKARDVRPTVRWALGIFCVGMTMPVLIGSSFHSRDFVPPGTTNEAALFILDALLLEAAPTVQFLFFLALSFTILTTIDTYLITFQQLYYEISIRSVARHPLTYIIQWALRWREVRVLALLWLMLTLVISLAVKPHQVYLLGVVGLSGPMFWTPIFLAVLLGDSYPNLGELLSPRLLISALILGILLAPGPVFFLSLRWGPLDDHLFLIFGGSALSSLLSLAGLLALAQARKRSGRAELSREERIRN